MKLAPTYPSRLPLRATPNHLAKLRAKYRPGTRWHHATLGRIEVRNVGPCGWLTFKTIPERRLMVCLWPFWLAKGRITRKPARPEGEGA